MNAAALVERAGRAEQRGIGSLWAGLAGVAFGGLAATMGLSMGLTAVLVACIVLIGVGSVEWLRLKKSRECRRARLKVREVLYAGVSEERDAVVQAIIDRGEDMWELSGIDDSDPVLWLASERGSQDAVVCGQALRLIEKWRVLCDIAQRSEQGRQKAARSVIAATSGMTPARREALMKLADGWNGTLSELVRAVNLGV